MARTRIKHDNKKDLEFQAVEWLECDISDFHPVENSDGSHWDNNHDKSYTILCFGVNGDGQSVGVRITNYKPYFYVRIPPTWTPNMIQEFDDNFINDYTTCDLPSQNDSKWYPQTALDKMGCIWWKTSLDTENVKVVERQIFWSFMNHRKFKFWQFYFASKEGSKAYAQYFKEIHTYNITQEHIKPMPPRRFMAKPQQSTSMPISNIDGYETEYDDDDDTELQLEEENTPTVQTETNNITTTSFISSTKKGIKAKFKLFEADLDPLLRFFHDAKIQPSGWLTLPAGTYQMDDTTTTCQINVSVDWNNVKPNERVGVPPLIVASFDIEADSSHGDFPIARKDTKKLANQLVIAWLRDQYALTKWPVSDHRHQEAKARCDTKEKFFESRILQALDMGEKVDDDISKIFLQTTSGLTLKVGRTHVFKTLCGAIYDICNRVIRKVKTSKGLKNASTAAQTRFDKLVECRKQEHQSSPSISDFLAIIKKVADDKAIEYTELRDKMMTKELLVHFVNLELKRFLPAVKGDPIIQIGTVFWKYGEEKPFHNSLLALAPKGQGCGEISGVTVESFNSELDMLMRWKELITQMDPDILVGYNTWGFDEAFMYDRLIELCPYNTGIKRYPDQFYDFLNLGRVQPSVAKYVRECRGGLLTKKLSSSALGDNYFYYFNTPGRVQIDLLKVVQASMTKLPSYKLDDVAEFYIGGKVCGIGRPDEDTTEWLKVRNIRNLSKLQLPATIILTYYDGVELPISVIEVQLDKRLVKLSSPISIRDLLPVGKLEDGKIIDGIGATSHWLKLEHINELQVGNFIAITMKETAEQLYDGKKLQIVEISASDGFVKLGEPVPLQTMVESPQWGIGKDDIDHHAIFRLQKGSDSDRAIIGKYCVQDCALLIRLLRKLETISNNFGMSNVCLVPFNFIFMRGQGIKIFSLITNECSQDGFVLPVLDKLAVGDKTATKDTSDINSDDSSDEEAQEVSPESQKRMNTSNGSSIGDECDYADNFNEIVMTNDSYEGAIVLDPKPDFYTHPISILDFGSLYPSEMIASNLSHDSFCEHPYWLGDEGGARIKALGYDYIDRSYDNYTWVDPERPSLGKKKNGVTTVRFVQFSEGKKGLIPRVLQKLLKARKAMKKLMESYEKSDPPRAVIYEGLQLAYKLTANSLYGQIGAKTSKIYKAAIAASTTAGGRARIIHAKNYVLEHFEGSEIVYGDTDSIFVKFKLTDSSGNMPEHGREAVARAIQIGIDAEHAIQPYLPAPHVLEYEKVFYPLMLITKKRYAGDKYETNPDKCKFTSMGIVLKRRDNAPILKYIYGGVIKILMKEMDVNKAVRFVRQACQDMLDDKFDLGMFVISKSLRDYYKDPEAIAHKVLADRMAERDPGNKPACNDRIPYAYIQTADVSPGTKQLQGDKIEHVAYIQEKNLKLDYVAYIENQLIKPISQIFELVVSQIEGFPYHARYFDDLRMHLMEKYGEDSEKVTEKLSDKKQEIVYNLVFHDVLMTAKNTRQRMESITKWFSPTQQHVPMTPKTPVTHAVEPKKPTKQVSLSGWLESSGDDVSVTVKKQSKKPIGTSSSGKQMSISAFFC